MAKLNLLLLLALAVVCALSLVTSRHQARKLFVELEREQAQARGYDVEYGQLQLEQSTWAMPARIEKIAREQLRMQLARTRPRAGDRRRLAMSTASALRRLASAEACRACARRSCSARCSRSSCCSSRALALPAVASTTAFLQEQGSSRYSRDLEVPAHRGRILDRLGEPLAISTPVKAIWAWPDKVEASPQQLAALAATLETRADGARGEARVRATNSSI